jgi:hypothetical protein
MQTPLKLGSLSHHRQTTQPKKTQGFLEENKQITHFLKTMVAV